ncbi:hypothetical protein PG985_010060 [Apiospora marii]|uniref:Uncharacterized protein n=1 Tax=Apiospora marii TaxID=335849 RepID=A0ABR1RMZ7_9PEZI
MSVKPLAPTRNSIKAHVSLATLAHVAQDLYGSPMLTCMRLLSKRSNRYPAVATARNRSNLIPAVDAVYRIGTRVRLPCLSSIMITTGP